MNQLERHKITAAIALALCVNNTNAADNKDNGLDEVLVTAQKRVQNAQKVPVALSSFSGDRLHELGVTDVIDLQTSAPSLIVSNTQTEATTNYSIRGVGTSGQNFGLESSVGLYVDGVYRTRQSSTINELIDIEAIEVLRGPQGTLFGRNTPSGAVQIRTKAPTPETDGHVNVTAGNFGLISANAAVGGSVSRDSKWTFRTTAFTSQRDGFVSDENLGDDIINDRDRSGARVQLQYKPNNDFSARLIADYSEIDEVCCGAATVRNNFFDFAGRPGTDSLLSALGGNIISEDRTFDDVTSLNSLPKSQNTDTGLSLELNYGDDSFSQLTSITAIRNFEQFTDIDADFSNVDLFRRLEDSENSSFSQELRYSYKSDRYEYVVGAYYFEQTVDSGARFQVGSGAAPFLGANPQISQLIAGATAAGVPVASITPAGSGSQDQFTQEHSSAALFGQLDYKLNDDLTLTLGARYTDEQKEVEGTFTQDNTGPSVDLNGIFTGDFSTIAALAFPGWGYTLGGPLTVIGARPDVQAEVDDSQITGTVKLSYSPTKNTFLYASYGTGFKSGGTNTDRIGPQFNTVFGAETSRSFELGLKQDFPLQGLRVNLSLHDTTTDDFQSIGFAGNGFNLINAGEVQTRGGELEVLWYPSDSLSISSAVVINDGEFSSFPGASCPIATAFQTGFSDPSEVNGVCDRSGGQLSFNPEEVFMLSMNKQFLVANKDAYLQADYFYRSSVLEDSDLDPLKEQEAYGLLNMRAGVFLGDGDTEFSLWIRNALDEDYLGTYFDVPLQDGKVSGYVNEPRTFGVSLRRKF